MAVKNDWNWETFQNYVKNSWVKYYRKADSRHTEIRLSSVQSIFNITDESMKYIIYHDKDKYQSCGIQGTQASCIL